MNAPALQAAEPDLTISIWPRAWSDWCGTRAQLIAEGLIPENLEWPGPGKSSRNWDADGFHYLLTRQRPPNFKGSLKAWAEVDHWQLRRFVAGQRDVVTPGQIYEKEQELRKILRRGTPAHHDEFYRAMKAMDDKAFQAFKAAFIPERRKPGRPAKAQQEGGAQ